MHYYVFSTKILAVGHVKTSPYASIVFILDMIEIEKKY